MATSSKLIHTNPHTAEGLRQSKQPARFLTENSSDITMLINAEHTITYASPSITPIMGYTPEEAIGCHIFTLIHPDDLAIIQLFLKEVRQTPGRNLSAEYRLRCKDGSWLWFAASGANLLHVPGVAAIVGTFHDITKQKLVPHLHANELSTHDHFVQFYETDDFLLDSVSTFIGAGLSQGDVCVVLGTKAHLEQLDTRLQGKGLDLKTARLHGEYITLDGIETLAKFMVDGLPEPKRFSEVIGNLIIRATKSQRPVRVFGEMVAHLWTEGNPAAAILLEDFWNNLRHTTPPFSLFCAYSMHSFAKEVHGAHFSEICQQHSQVIPDESYILLNGPDERLRAITLLQQKANSLEAEVAERKAAEAKFQQLFDSNLIGVFVSDFAGTFLEANNAFLNLIGYTQAELQAGSIQRDTLSPPEFHPLSQLAVKALHETGSSGTYEKEYLHKSGKRIPVLVAVTRIEHTETCIGLVLDISERKELETRKDEFISMASHELKTPLTSLKGFLHLLQRRLIAQEDEKGLYYLTRMDDQVNKLTKLISDLLDISKMQTGQLAYREERFALDTLVQETVENVQATTQTHQLQLTEQTQVEVFGDRDRIGQVLINLLTNAVKYSPHANTVCVRIAKEENKVRVSIQDFGIGIAQVHQQKIFERFYQVTDPEEKTYPGLGIGLYISGTIIKRHGGQVWVESKKAEGSTFHFTLPLA